MAESAEELYARVLEAAGPEGRLPMPATGQWDVFPWEAIDGTVVPKPLPAPRPERVRMGEPGGEPCGICAGIDPDRIVWEDEFWVLTRDEKPTGLPLVLTLWTREPLDSGDFDDDLSSQFGRICNRLVRIMQGV